MLHPLMYSTLYVTVTTLAPMAWLLSRGNLGYIVLENLSPETPTLMALTVVGFAVGGALPFKKIESPPIPHDGKTITHFERLLFLLPFGVALDEDGGPHMAPRLPVMSGGPGRRR